MMKKSLKEKVFKHSLKQQKLEESALLEKKQVWKGVIFSLREDRLKWPSGNSHKWDVIEHPGAVAIIPVDQKEQLILIQQWRWAVKEILYEIPAGTLEEGETPIECAQRELQEEIGHKSEMLISLGGFYTAPGYCTEFIHLFLAKNLIKSSLDGDDHEGIDLVEINLSKALELIDQHKIKDVKTISGILQYERWKKIKEQ
ncbi:MAG: NUDIX hydrolase [Chlamydiae bacterium]|nr:NUDIX hydrolase [Chlamydiota bacterium]